MSKKTKKSQEATEETPVNEVPDNQSAPEEADSAATLLELLNAAEAKRDEYLALAQRLQADFDNFRRRNQATYADALAQGKCDAVEKLLPVLDNIERALTAQGEEANLRQGIEMITKQFVQALAGMGVEEIPALGEVFDPNVHNAVMREACDAKSGTVSDVLQKGYKLNDKVLRYSMVKVAE